MVVRIEQYGDSTTQGWQAGPSVGYTTPASAPAQLQEKLQSIWGSSVVVSNQGVGGTQATQLLNGTDGVHPIWNTQMTNSTAQIVTINFGLNDAYYSKVNTPPLVQETADTFTTALTSLVTIAKSHSKTVILMEPNPTCEPIRQQSIVPFVQAIQNVANSQNVAIVHHFSNISAMQNWQGLLSDGLHPSDILYWIKASAEFDVIAPLVKTLLG